MPDIDIENDDFPLITLEVDENELQELDKLLDSLTINSITENRNVDDSQK